MSDRARERMAPTLRPRRGAVDLVAPSSRVVIALLLAAAAQAPACAADTGVPSGLDSGGQPVDASPEGPPGCTPTFGRTYILDTLEIRPSGEGADLNGDGVPDNALGVLAFLANDGFRQGIASGESIFLWDVVEWTDPPTPDDPDIGLVFYQAMDADVPDNPANNVSGSGEFRALPSQFDAACQPTSRWDEATLASGVLSARTRTFGWVAPWIGTLEFVNASMVIAFSPDFAGITEGLFSAVWTTCSMSRSLFPGSTEGTFLDVMVATFGQGPDIDLDGDGLERLETDGQRVIRCVDGDGTVIDGSDCTCDPRIGDGYSVAMRASAVPARIVGVWEQ